MLPLAPCAMMMLPELVPLLVLRTKLPVPFVVRLATALASPMVTVSADSTTSPRPFGIRLMLALVLVLLMVLSLMLRLAMFEVLPEAMMLPTLRLANAVCVIAPAVDPSDVVVMATNWPLVSSHTKAALLLVPLLTKKPESLVGAPVVPLLRTMTGSAM